MKRIALSIMAVAISFAAMAQNNKENHKQHHKGDRKEFRHKGREFGENLNLSDQQKAQLKSINENFRSQVKDLQENKSLSEEALKEKRRTLKAEHKAQVQAILTPEQKKQWEEKKKEHGFKHKERRSEKSHKAVK